MRIFLSHAWTNDTHKRVKSLCAALQTDERCTPWFDDDELLHGHVEAAMINGIERSDVVAICVTKDYCTRVVESSNSPHVFYNSAKEWEYATLRRKHRVAVLMEPMFDTACWPPGPVTMHLGNNLYVDARHADKKDEWLQVASQLIDTAAAAMTAPLSNVQHKRCIPKEEVRV